MHLRYICSLAPQLKWTQTSVLQLSSQFLNFAVYLELMKIIILIFEYLHWYFVTCKFYNRRYFFLERLWKALPSSQVGQACLCHKKYLFILTAMRMLVFCGAELIIWENLCFGSHLKLAIIYLCKWHHLASLLRING